MYQDAVVLCSASKYTQKFYLNPDFEGLPEQVKQELKIMCVLFTEEAGGIILLMFDENGNLTITTEADEGDLLYDEIGAHLLIKRMRSDKRELFLQLEQYYALFFLNEE
ncbi:MAG: hypothetical protein IKQ49_04090 [Eubacterium sp.]|nr:hypothetical protein [Eubacterium sp.]MBR6172337.1 hypothetical protein [Eubacterium sp.]